MPTATGLPTTGPLATGMSNEELRGRSSGTVVGAVMGMVWAASVVGALGTAVLVVPVLTAGAAIVTVLMMGARRLRRAAAGARVGGTQGISPGRARNRFAQVVAGESVAIAVSINVLVRADRAEWVPAVVCVVVGVHFLPLARLFRVRLYYLTAAALLLVAATTALLGAAGVPAAVWRLLPGLGAAAVLWATSAGLLVTTAMPAEPAVGRVRRRRRSAGP